MEKQLYAYKTYPKDAPEIQGIDWKVLDKYVSSLRSFQETCCVARDVEEEPPSIDDAYFYPGGWVGTYRVDDHLIRVVPNPSRLSLKEFEQIRNELAGWLEHLGPFFENFSRFYMNEAIFKDCLFATYSKRLREYTEIAVSQFVHREARQIEFVGTEIRGKPVWKKILLSRAKDSNVFTSKMLEFSVRNPQNLLLTRFHAELLEDINRFFEKNSALDGLEVLRDWKAEKAYHEEFINSGIWADLLEESLLKDFDDYELIERIRRTAKSESAEILDLWEAYRANRSFLVDYGKRFDLALKPLSKIYELWCLKKLCEILGIDTKTIKKLPPGRKLKCTKLGKNRNLYYAAPLRKHSGTMKKIRSRFPVGKPDFAVESSGRITCIMDAKCKTIASLGIEDLHRMFSYVLDYVYPTNETLHAIIFYISRKREIKTIPSKHFQLHLVPMTPTTFEMNKDKIARLIRSTLKR